MAKTQKPFCQLCKKVFCSKKYFKNHHLQTHNKLKCLQCEFCDRRYPVKSELYRHILSHIEERPFPCQISCNKSFYSIGDKSNHEKICGKPKAFQCKKCTAKFVLRETLQKHKEEHRLKDSHRYQCKICGKDYLNRKRLSTHLKRVHENEISWSCIFCKYVVFSGHEQEEHILQHAEEQPYHCNVDSCERSFFTRTGLLRHRRFHTECKICGEKFEDTKELVSHKRIQHARKIFHCDICPTKRFLNYGELVIHKRRHANEKPYKCDLCNKAFYSYTSLTTHLKSHTLEKPAKCNICGGVFSREGSLRMHVKKVHEKFGSFDSAFCPRTFPCKGDHWIHIMAHIEEKAHFCKLCGKEFAKKCQSTSHSRVHKRNKNISCGLCGKRFHQPSSFRYHRLQHYYVKDMNGFKCQICEDRFEKSSSVAKHLNGVHKREVLKLPRNKL